MLKELFSYSFILDYPYTKQFPPSLRKGEMRGRLMIGVVLFLSRKWGENLENHLSNQVENLKKKAMFFNNN